MSFNRTCRSKVGETGFIIRVRLYDDLERPIDLSEGGTWAVEGVITTQGSTTAVIGPFDMTNDPDQTYNEDTGAGNRGYTEYALTAEEAETAAADYDLEIVATEPTGTPPRKHYFPKDNGDVFGTFIQMQSKYVAP